MDKIEIKHIPPQAWEDQIGDNYALIKKTMTEEEYKKLWQGEFETPDLYIPKGGMCKVCKWCDDDCQHLTFESMPVIDGKDDKIKIVKCNAFIKDVLLNVPLQTGEE